MHAVLAHPASQLLLRLLLRHIRRNQIACNTIQHIIVSMQIKLRETLRHVLRRGLILGFLPRATVHRHDELHSLVVGGEFLRNEMIVGQTLCLAALVLCSFLQHHITQHTARVGVARRSILESEHSRLRSIVAIRRGGVRGDRHFVR